MHGLHLEIEGREILFRLIGVFNAYNLLAVYGAAVLLGEDPTECLTILSGLTTAPGRFEPVVSASKRHNRQNDEPHPPPARGKLVQKQHQKPPPPPQNKTGRVVVA
ncbi:MAG: hypothetical protein NVSMB30_09540 [Hymenobacter sp.]